MPIVRSATAAMGTRFEFVLAGGDEGRLRAAADEAIDEVLFWHARLSAFDAGSWVSLLNGRAGERPAPLDDELLELLEDAAAVWRDSGGVFDATVGPLMRAWGFRGGGTPDQRAVAAATGVTGMHHLRVDRSARLAMFDVAGALLDLGGIAKGHALDHAAAVVRDAGVDCALLHGGTSTVVAIGAPPGEAGWRIALAGDRARVVTLRDEALSVSAPGGRTVELDGRVLGHVLDPRRGAPCEGAEMACAVHASARLADAWSTALLVLAERPRNAPADLTSAVRRCGAAWEIRGPGAKRFKVSEASTLETAA